MSRRGHGLLNDFIGNLKTELHIPSYQYCGPGTKLSKRLARGDSGINPLDRACKLHDIAYSQNKDLKSRHVADQQLENQAWKRVKSKDASFGEKAAAWLVTNAMKAKRKLGMGIKRKQKRGKISKTRRRKLLSLRKAVIDPIKKGLKSLKNNKNLEDLASHAVLLGKEAIGRSGGRKNIRTPRIIPVPKTGGILPLLPLLAGLGAIGSLAGGASQVAKAVIKSKNAAKQLDELKRHNESMEAIALGKKGSGLFLAPYRQGMGLYLNPAKNFP